MRFQAWIPIVVLWGCLCSCSNEEQPQNQAYLQLQAMIQEVDQSFSDVAHINVTEVKKLQPESFQFIDVREREEQAISILPNAISLEQFQKQPELYKNKLLIPYCTIGYRSAIHTKRLINQGFEAKNLRGSILNWIWADLPLENKNQVTKKVHVYGPKWNLVPAGYESVQ